LPNAASLPEQPLVIVISANAVQSAPNSLAIAISAAATTSAAAASGLIMTKDQGALRNIRRSGSP